MAAAAKRLQLVGELVQFAVIYSGFLSAAVRLHGELSGLGWRIPN